MATAQYEPTRTSITVFPTGLDPTPLVINDVSRLLPPPEVCKACDGTGFQHRSHHRACLACNGEGVL